MKGDDVMVRAYLLPGGTRLRVVFITHPTHTHTHASPRTHSLLPSFFKSDCSPPRSVHALDILLFPVQLTMWLMPTQDVSEAREGLQPHVSRDISQFTEGWSVRSKSRDGKYVLKGFFVIYGARVEVVGLPGGSSVQMLRGYTDNNLSQYLLICFCTKVYVLVKQQIHFTKQFCLRFCGVFIIFLHQVLC